MGTPKSLIKPACGKYGTSHPKYQLNKHINSVLQTVRQTVSQITLVSNSARAH